jgi:hypothetical protein
MRRPVLAALVLTAASVFVNGPIARADGAPTVVWEESFGNGFSVGNSWKDPAKHDLAALRQVFSIGGQALHARHDGAASDAPPALHFGHPFVLSGTETPNQPLANACILQWKWRVIQHPTVTSDPWKDVAASVYVVFRTPTLFRSGEGFKFGWLAKAGPAGTTQHGIQQVELRHDGALAAGAPMIAERVDLCALYKSTYGDPKGAKLLYIGVVTDGDNTKSLAAADYSAFQLSDR